MGFFRKITAGLTLALCTWTAPVNAVPITINYLDGPGYGFNDPVLGHARRAAFEVTMSAFAGILQGNVPISVDTYFVYNVGNFGYNEGWPNSLNRDFPGVEPGVYYPTALANQIANIDTDPALSDVTIIFNGDMDIHGGIYGERWYYGWDGNAGSNVDFITEVAHGFLRGLGFYTLMDASNGEYFLLTGDTGTYPDILTKQLAFVFDTYNVKLTDVTAELRHWALNTDDYVCWTGPALTQAIGGYVPMYAPYVPPGNYPPYGVADHFHPNLGIRQIMTPWYMGPCHDLSVVYHALKDMGWELN